MNSSLQVLSVETGLTVRYVMVKIVEAATTISPPRRPRSLIIAMVIIGSMYFLSFLKWMKRVNLGIDTPFSGDIVSLAVANSRRTAEGVGETTIDLDLRPPKH